MLNALEKQLLDALKATEWSGQGGGGNDPFCWVCQGERDHGGHKAGCSLSDAIAKAEECAKVGTIEQRIRALATKLWEDDDCVVDEAALVALSDEDGGAWVQVWQRIGPETLRENGIETPGMEPPSSEETEGDDEEEDDDDDDGCPKCDPDCLGNNGDCHDACEWPAHLKP